VTTGPHTAQQFRRWSTIFRISEIR